MTNAELGIPEYKVRKKSNKPRYVKSAAIKDFEKQYDDWWYNEHPLPDDLRFEHKFDDKTANSLTKLIMMWFKVNGHFSGRVNTQGNYNAKLGKWVKSGSTRGMADISAVVDGRSISVEVKIGKDKVRESQLKVKAQMEKAGGVYLIVRTFEDFIEQFNGLNL